MTPRPGAAPLSECRANSVRPEEGGFSLAQSHLSRNQRAPTVLRALSDRFLPPGKSMTGEPKRVDAPRDSQRYREVASKLRGIARQSRVPGTRQKILDFAARYEGRANQVDGRGTAGGSGQEG